MDKQEWTRREAELLEIIEKQNAIIAALTARIVELEAQIQQNSRNSSKPPSSDGLRKPPVRSLREKTGRKPGGQKGHKGHGLTVEREPDEVIEVEPVVCSECGTELSGEPKFHADTRYVYDVEINVVLRRYDIAEAICPNCGAATVGTPPKDCRGTVNYGQMIRTLCVVLTQYGYMGIDKTHKVLHDLLMVPISSGTIKNIMSEWAGKTGEAIAEIKRNLLLSPILNVDETGGRVAGRTQWFHVASNSKYTLISIHKKRGSEGSEAAGVVQNYNKTMIHDCWAPYFGFDKAKHALCCAHLLRELNALIERGQKWAVEMKSLLLEMKKVVDTYKYNDKVELSRYYRDKFSARYETVLSIAKAEIVMSTTRKKSKAENLLNRFVQYQTEITRFTQDFDVPFDNNQAERDVRNIKVKGKVSGCFRTETGAKDYANTASVFGTVAKLGFSVVGAVRNLFVGDNPLLNCTTE
jgi:transposase